MSPQIAAGMAGRVVSGDGSRRALGDNGAVLPALGSQVDDPAGGADGVEVVLDDDHGLPPAMSRSTMPSSRSMSAGWRPVVGSSTLSAGEAQRPS